MKIIASMGHGEYGLVETPGVTVKMLWDSSEWEQDRDPDPLDWREKTGLIEMPDADLTFESIIEIEGKPDAILRALALLLMDLAFTPGADDGTYDYWPSGMRFARTIIDAIGPHHPYDDLHRGSNGVLAIWQAVARHIILETDELGYNRADQAEELFDRIGWPEEAEKHPVTV